jgi:hypothetical protein
MGSRLSRLIGRSRSRSHSSLLALDRCRLRRTTWSSKCCCEAASCQRRGGTGDGVRWCILDRGTAAPCITAQTFPHRGCPLTYQADEWTASSRPQPWCRHRALAQACCGTSHAEPVGAVTESWMTVSVVESLLVQAMLHHVALVCACGELRVRALVTGSWALVRRRSSLQGLCTTCSHCSGAVVASAAPCGGSIIDAMPTYCVHMFE